MTGMESWGMGSGMNVKLTATMTVPAVQPDDQQCSCGERTRKANSGRDMADNSAMRLVRYEKW